MPVDLSQFLETIKDLPIWEQYIALTKAQILPLGMLGIGFIIIIFISALSIDEKVLKYGTVWRIILFPIIFILMYLATYPFWLWLLFKIW